MWRAGNDTGKKNVKTLASQDDDDWDTDPDFVNNVSEQEQRWGAKSVAGSGRVADVSVKQLTENVIKTHEEKKKEEYFSKQTFAHGYGGKFGVQNVMDKSAVSSNAPTVTTKPTYTRPEIHANKEASSIRSRFENMNAALEKEELERRRVDEERRKNAAVLNANAERLRAEREAVQREHQERARAEQERHEQEERARKEEERKRRDEEAARRRHEEEERAARLRAEDQEREARRRAQQDEQRRRQEDEEFQRRRAAEEEAHRREQEEYEARQRAEQEEYEARQRAEQEEYEARQRAEQEQYEAEQQRLAQEEADRAAQEEYEQQQQQHQQHQEEQYYQQEEQQQQQAGGASARAVFDYQASGDDEISFDVNDIIANIDFVDEGWWFGTGPDGRQGLFPANYVELIQ